jgi:hypothetical protein
MEKKTKSAEFYKKRLEKLKSAIKINLAERKIENKNWITALNSMRDIREEEAQRYETEIGRLNNLIGIMKTGRIRYESTIEYPISDNFSDLLESGSVEKVSGVLFLQEIQQVELRPDHVLIVTNSGREIKLGKSYDYLQDIFSIK